jgi:hypothetical protein
MQGNVNLCNRSNVIQVYINFNPAFDFLSNIKNLIKYDNMKFLCIDEIQLISLSEFNITLYISPYFLTVNFIVLGWIKICFSEHLF